ncbi:MAG: hypothetical protein FJ291_12900 [Planctomycetes bacterium]|nr:hypothetical protein [Planctomycetota bacterium]
MSEQVRFYVTVPEGPLPAGTRVILSMELENASKDPLYVNTRFAAGAGQGDVWLKVQRDGQVLPCTYILRLGPLLNSDFLLLQPGEHTVGSYELTRGYRLDKPGTYQITAQYVSQEVPDALARMKVFRGQVQAPPVQLILK